MNNGLHGLATKEMVQLWMVANLYMELQPFVYNSRLQNRVVCIINILLIFFFLSPGYKV